MVTPLNSCRNCQYLNGLAEGMIKPRSPRHLCHPTVSVFLSYTHGMASRSEGDLRNRDYRTRLSRPSFDLLLLTCEVA